MNEEIIGLKVQLISRQIGTFLINKLKRLILITIIATFIICSQNHYHNKNDVRKVCFLFY